MKRSEWSDKQLEELLRQMPKIKDHRDPRDIYQNLSIKKRKTITWILPSIAAAAALLLFFILVPQLMDGTQYSLDKASEEKSSSKQDMKTAEINKDSAIAWKKGEATSKQKAFSGSTKTELMSVDNIKTAIYDDEVGNGTVLTYWIPDPQGQILIPVSTVVNDTGDKSWLTLFNEKMAGLKEKEWGLSDFYPVNATLKPNDNSVIVDVPSNHSYKDGSTTETNFINILKHDLSSNSNIKKIKFTTNGQPGIEFGNFGLVKEIDIAPQKNHAFFFYYPEGSDLPFLTPSVVTYKDVKTAIEGMKDDQKELGLKSPLLPTIQINDVSTSDNALYITLDGNSRLHDDQQSLCWFEALLLTAKEFGLEKVVVKGAPLTHLGPFDLTKEIRVPLAPNMRNIQ